MVRGRKLGHVSSDLCHQSGGCSLFDPRDRGTQGNGLLVVTDLVLNLGVELGDLCLSEYQLRVQDPQHPAMMLRHAALQSQLHGRQLRAQAAPRERSEFAGVLFAR